VRAGLQVSGLRLRVGDRRHAHRPRLRPVHHPAAHLPEPVAVMTTMTPAWQRVPRLVVIARYVLLSAGAIIMILPFLYMLSTSFKGQQYVLTTPPQWIPHPATVSNYTTAWNTDHFPHYFLNSVVVAVATTGLSLLLSSMMAYAFARFDFPMKETLFKVLLLGL